MPGNYDAKNDTSCTGCRAMAPWLGDQRPGDKSSIWLLVLAPADTGEIIGPSPVPLERLGGLAGMNAPTIVEFERNGKKVPGLISAQRNGYLTIDRRTARSDL